MTTSDEDVLLQAPLTPDAFADGELEGSGLERIADEDLRGSRLLLLRRAVEHLELPGSSGGALQIACTFHPAPGCRFTWARISMHFTTPSGLQILDVAPRETREREAVQLTVDRTGKLGIKTHGVEASAKSGTQAEFAVYHCAIQGSGEGTDHALWDLTENAHRKDGVGREQLLAVTLPGAGVITAALSVNARLVRSGVAGKFDAVRDLILGRRDAALNYTLAFTIPEKPPATGLSRFLRLLG